VWNGFHIVTSKVLKQTLRSVTRRHSRGLACCRYPVNRHASTPLRYYNSRRFALFYRLTFVTQYHYAINVWRTTVAAISRANGTISTVHFRQYSIILPKLGTNNTVFTKPLASTYLTVKIHGASKNRKTANLLQHWQKSELRASLKYWWLSYTSAIERERDFIFWLQASLTACVSVSDRGRGLQ